MTDPPNTPRRLESTLAGLCERLREDIERIENCITNDGQITPDEEVTVLSSLDDMEDAIRQFRKILHLMKPLPIQCK